MVTKRRIKDFPSMVLVDAVLGVPDPASARAFIVTYAEAFGVAVPAASAKPAKPALLRVDAVNLAEGAKRDASGSFSGTGGTWTASKWTIERKGHDAEVYFNYDLTSRRGEFGRKDGDYDKDIVGDFADVLRDGAEK